jgi:N-acetylglutamate synthase-like GNAT family acetyltransferase
VSSFQPNSLPDGYVLRLATEQDLIRILYFECFSHDTNSMGRVLMVLLFLYVATIFTPEARTTIILIFVFGLCLFLSLLVPVYKKSKIRLNNGTSIYWIVCYENTLCAYICCENTDGYNIISRLLVGNNYQNRGLGRNLMRNCIQSVEKPIYLRCLLNLKNFYNRFGFIETSFFDAPIEISRSLKTKNACLMIFDETSI